MDFILGEIWKIFKNNYYVSNFGRVKSGNRFLKTKIPFSYDTVKLTISGKRKGYYVHVLVASLFVDNFNNYPYINHKDGNKTNNKADNLEWCTSSQNIIHSIENGLRRSVKKVVVYSLDKEVLGICNSAKEAAVKYNLASSTIINSCKKVFKSNKRNLIFEYYKEDKEDKYD